MKITRERYGYVARRRIDWQITAWIAIIFLGVLIWVY